jgi:hypothetical protein
MCTTNREYRYIQHSRIGPQQALAQKGGEVRVEPWSRLGRAARSEYGTSALGDDAVEVFVLEPAAPSE